MHDAITDSTKHCRMAAPVADNALLLEPNCIYVCMFICITYADVERQSWDKFVINCFIVWYNLYLAIRGLYHPRLRLGWYSPLIARYKLYHISKQLITNDIHTHTSQVQPCPIMRFSVGASLTWLTYNVQCFKSFIRGKMYGMSVLSFCHRNDQSKVIRSDWREVSY